MPESTSAAVVRERREQLQLTRERLASQAGTSVSTIVRIENYGLLPTIKTLSAIAEVLGLTLDEIARPDRTAS